MRIVYFTHSLISCWNHGNAHFLRGVVRALLASGHEVTVYEPQTSWSRTNLNLESPEAEGVFTTAFPSLAARTRIMPDSLEGVEAAVDGADLVIVHEWNDPALVASIGGLRRQGGGFTLLFHDTHHRMVSDPHAMSHFDLSEYDAVLAFGDTLSQAYQRHGWADRVFTWHEAADDALFHPSAETVERKGAVWIGNWGDGERSQELRDYMLRPTRTLGIPLDIYGVRYPDEARAELAQSGAHYHGWAANARAPEIFARHLFTMHVPRRFYVTQLPGIPTIRVFEALACGIPLLSAPWDDREGLFAAGLDYLQAHTPAMMEILMRDLLHDVDLRDTLTAHGLATIRARHTCTHRVTELLAIVARLSARAPQVAA
jgi:spore maturation protein CgeB